MKGLQILLMAVIAVSLYGRVESQSTGCPDACGAFAKCNAKTNKCDCLGNFISNRPEFVCYPRLFIICQIYADPMIEPFKSKVAAGIKMPAALPITALTAKGLGKKGKDCKFILDGWSQRFGGKYFIEGLQFRVKKFDDESFKVIAKVTGTVYTWTIQKKSGPSWSTLTILTMTSKKYDYKLKGCVIRFWPHAFSKFLVVDVFCCRVQFGIRAYNPTNTNIIPGIYVRVREKDAQGLVSLPDRLCDNGKGGPDPFQSLISNYNFHSRTQVTTFLGLAYGNPDYPMAFSQLADLQTKLDTCPATKRSALMTKADFLFELGKLIGCIGDDDMSLTYNVTQGYCDNNAQACAAAISHIQTTCPNVMSSELQAFFNNGCV